MVLIVGRSVLKWGAGDESRTGIWVGAGLLGGSHQSKNAFSILSSVMILILPKYFWYIPWDLWYIPWDELMMILNGWTLPRVWMNLVVHPQQPRDFPRPERCPEGELGNNPIHPSFWQCTYTIPWEWAQPLHWVEWSDLTRNFDNFSDKNCFNGKYI